MSNQTEAVVPTIVKIKIPAPHVEVIRGHLVSAYRGIVDDLGHAAAAIGDSGESPERLLRYRREIANLEQLLDQIGWADEAEPPAAIEISGSADALSPVLAGALGDALTELSDELTTNASDDGKIAVAQEAMTRINGLYRLLLTSRPS